MSVCFVMSGGASLGAIQAGMLRALYERGVAPDVIVGTSVGAVNGAFIASRPRRSKPCSQAPPSPAYHEACIALDDPHRARPRPAWPRPVAADRAA
jgi:hypothetical protein